MNEKNPQRKTSIGGQALIEGVMMRGPITSAMAIRTPGGEIDLETWSTNSGKRVPWYKKVPFVRGCFNFIDTLITGYRCLMTSAEKAGIDLEEEPSKFEKKLMEWFGDKTMKVVTGFAMVLAVLLAGLLFFFLPAFLSKLLSPYIPGRIGMSAVEGAIKIGIFLLYLTAVSRMEDIKRVFGYHGAEHKTIACYEAGEALTVENVRRHVRFHPRCGTSFLLIVLIISILVSSVVTWDNLMVRVALKVIMLPLVVSIAYELIKLAGRYDNWVTRIISAPGLWLQRLTTFEPQDDQIECAIASMVPCIPEDNNDDRW